MLAGGLLLEQTRGSAPLSTPCFEQGVRINVVQLRKKNEKHSIAEVRENMYFVCREKFTNQINTGCCTRIVYKAHLGPIVLWQLTCDREDAVMRGQ